MIQLLDSLIKRNVVASILRFPYAKPLIQSLNVVFHSDIHYSHCSNSFLEILTKLDRDYYG
jgi:hypothetical protein